ncbi:uncharacterized protein LOC135493693 isoform X2 [Lineus longissimus]|uniref:uncharacterized protein LOC135493693 isoform X2 n=1 Tax=Lineus longissimus TaxID=88925 RepID=UPI002B4E2082
MAAAFVRSKVPLRGLKTSKYTCFLNSDFQKCHAASYFMLRRSYSNNVSSDKKVRIGCASAFWGDTAVAAPQLIQKGNVDYLVFDYLSEITMSLLTAVKSRMPEMGFAPDFIHVVIAPFIKDIKSKGIRVISNAGGVNPHSCARAIKKICNDAGIEMKIAVVTGDDIMPLRKEISQMGFKDLVSGEAFPRTVHSMNAYLGAGPIARALDLGADIVITGRCADSAVALGPLIHEFKWAKDNYDLLAAGSLAGHLIECGAQSTGGVFTDWFKIKDWDNIGFPIVECSKDGSFLLTKPPKTGGLVSPATVGEQLVYEIGDPANYLLPDVVCDFTQVKIEEIPGRIGQAVKVTGAKGYPAPKDYKVCATYSDGYRATAVCLVGGPESVMKGKKTAEAILKRTRVMFKQLGMEDYMNVNVQVIGSESTYGNQAHINYDLRESAVWIAVHHRNKKALEFFAREIAPAGTGMAPGLTTIVGGRPKVSPVLKLFSYLIPRDMVKVELSINDDHLEILEELAVSESQDRAAPVPAPAQRLPRGDYTFRLEELIYARSGDKGNTVNIGILARHPSYVPYLRQALTPRTVARFFQHLFEDGENPEECVERYELPGIDGFNFVLKNALGGGGIASLRTDPQGKAVAQMFLDFRVKGVPNLVKIARDEMEINL